MLIRPRVAAISALLIAFSLMLGIRAPGPVAADEQSSSPSSELVAYLDGVPIPLADVSKYSCDDFSFPTINCSRVPLLADARTALFVALTGIEYVTIYDKASYGGSYMNVSQDYSALGLIGWNDKISSFIARNGETGSFWTDWLYLGSSWSFCCNTQQPSLGGYDNTFSSVKRT